MAKVWPWWPQSIAETLEFQTDVRMARTGEWRDSLKDATQFLTLGHLLQHAKAEAMIAAVEENAIGEWLVPEWPNATVSTSTLAVAATTIPVAVPEAYTVGRFVFVGLDDSNWEIGEVDSIGATDITLVEGLVSAYAGSVHRPVVIAPLVLSIAPGGVEFQTSFPLQGVSTRFMAVEPLDLAANSYSMHSNRPIVIDGRVAFSPLAGAMNQASDLFESGLGAYSLQAVENYTRRRGVVSWYDKGPENRWARRKFLHFLRGRDGEFWLPTGQNDMPLMAAVTSGAVSILVKPCASNANMVGKRILLREGTNAVIREVMGAGSVGDNQSLSIIATGVAFTTAAVVSLVPKSRLDTDQVEIAYQFAGGGLAMFCSAPVIEVS